MLSTVLALVALVDPGHRYRTDGLSIDLGVRRLEVPRGSGERVGRKGLRVFCIQRKECAAVDEWS
jgi:hypothetical protein